VKVYAYAYAPGLVPTGMKVTAEGGTTATLATGATFVTVTGSAGADGVLTLTLKGGALAFWVVNGIEVTLT